MNVSMSLATLLIGGVMTLLTGLPGMLLHRVWLHRLGLSWRVGIALVLAFVTVLFADVASLVRYRFLLMAGLWGGFIAMIAVMWWRNRDTAVERRPLLPLILSDGTGYIDILFHIFLLAFYLAPAFVLYLPLDTDAQGFGYLALMVRQGGTINTLAPWQPDVQYLYSPGLFVLWAFLSDLLILPMHQVMLPSSHLMAALTAWLCIDLAAALFPNHPRIRWLLPLMLMAGMGLFLALMDSHYTTIFGFLFVTLFLTLAFKAIRASSLPLALLASIALAAIALTHPDTIIILLIGYIPFYATFWLSREDSRNRNTWLRLFVLIPAVGFIFTLPWLLRVLPLFFEDMIVSPFVLSARHVTQLVLYQGILVPLIALSGVALAARRRALPDILILTWLLFILDFSITGLLDRLIDLSGINIMRYVYPFSVAWHGPILVYPILASLALDRFLKWKPLRLSPAIGSRVLIAGLLAMLLAVLFHNPILALSFGRVNFYGAFSSRADLAAMTYLRQHASPDALILNYPYGQEAHWVPVIAERQAVTFRDQPFFFGAEPYYLRRDALASVYLDLADPTAREMVIDYGVDYIIVPQVFYRPSVYGDLHALMRWRIPDMQTFVDPHTIPWLESVFDQDGAAVFRAIP